jgi:hypothetical protein
MLALRQVVLQGRTAPNPLSRSDTLFRLAAFSALLVERRHNSYAFILRDHGAGPALSDLGRKFGKILEHMFIPNLNDIREHGERMEKLWRYFDLHDDKRKLYRAVAAAVISGNMRGHAL